MDFDALENTPRDGSSPSVLRNASLLALTLFVLGCAGSRVLPEKSNSPEDRVDAQAARIASLIVADPKIPPELFEDSFTKEVPPAQLATLLAKSHAQNGNCSVAGLLKRLTPLAAQYRVHCDRGFDFPLSVRLDESSGKIEGLWFGPSESTADLETVRAELMKLPGQVAVEVAPLEGGAPLFSIAPDQKMAIASTFKLYVLAALLDSVNRGAHRWEESVKLSQDARSMLSGTIQTWPIGTPVTLATLAIQMISQSDNTATDTLIRFLGRSAIEATMAKAGNRSASGPLLTTREAFNLKDDTRPELLKAYVPLAPEARLAFLETHASQFQADGLRLSRPTGIGEVEWFATPREVAAAFRYLRERTPAGSFPMEVLAVNPGLASKERFQYVGFKGGSEPGVLCFAHLLQRKSGEWMTVVAIWNNPDAALEDERLIPLVGRLMELAATPP